MALEELIYYRFDLNKQRMMRSLINRITPCFSFHDFKDETPYTVNVPLLLYAVAGELHANILYDDCKIHTFGSSQHLSAYLHHYLHAFHESNPTLALRVPGVVEFTGTILHFDTDVKTSHENTLNRNGIVFAYENELHDREGFMTSLRRFLPSFDRGLAGVKSRGGPSYERFNLTQLLRL